ncbi:uncharacterized protein LOC127095253 [Lathyrus oleraceus]|uniref:uncharacterized protein LOC127095253 n=1 Tax=Pisum sativum TaxID=3888 RepID=UPI0021CEC4D5|nr:uncharacterized protein LOC127095253 [Pisum sativum]
MHFNSYVNHCETQPFDDIVLYSGWLACGSRLTAPYLPECVTRQFGYTQTIPKHPGVSAPPATTHRDMDAMFDDYQSHLVPEEAQSTIIDSDWNCVDMYIKWFFRASLLYMVQVAPGYPPRLAH